MGGSMNLNKIVDKLEKAYDLLLYNDDLESEEARGFILEVFAMLEDQEGTAPKFEPTQEEA
jgi:hypothetical protein